MHLQELANTLWAYATLRYSPGAVLLNWLTQAIALHAHELQPQNLSNILWAYATMGCDPGDNLMTALDKQVNLFPN